jgi:hypothetical protein
MHFVDLDYISEPRRDGGAPPEKKSRKYFG